MLSDGLNARVTLTSQSAVSLGRIDGFCPTFDISMDFSSMKREGPNVTDDVFDELELCDTLPVLRVMKYAGLKIPDGTKAGP